MPLDQGRVLGESVCTMQCQNLIYTSIKSTHETVEKRLEVVSS